MIGGGQRFEGLEERGEEGFWTFSTIRFLYRRDIVWKLF